MPYRESPSPAQRPQLTERSSSAHSLSRASPSTGKGSTTKLHKAHGVGHGRHPHGRVPSHGRNLNRLSKLGSAHPQDESDKSKLQTKAKAQTPSTSPSTADASSSTNVGRTNSKASLKKNSSNLSQKRNKSLTKLGNLTGTGKAGIERKGPYKANSRSAQFSIGSDDQDDDWTEADSSQSPENSRREPLANGKAHFGHPISPDQPPLRSPTKLPASPPQSPPDANSEVPASNSSKHEKEPGGPYSRESDAEAVTRRLLDRNTACNAKPQTSAVSATITPSGSSGSPAFNFSEDGTLRNDQSMPSNGISRFLNADGSPLGSATPHSHTHLNPALTGTSGAHEHRDSAQLSSPAHDRNAAKDLSRRARSTADLPPSKQQRPVSQSSSPGQHSPQSAVRTVHPSPFALARDHQSATQLKLDLQRISANREPAHAPVVQPPATGAHASFANLGLMGNEGGMDQRKRNQWNQAEREYQNGRNFIGIIAKGLERLEKRGKVNGARDVRDDMRERDGGRRSERSTIVSTSVESRPESRGRIRFEIGGRQGDERNEADTDSDGGGLEGLLRRMWEGDGQSGVED
ncbi:MAG: hypothetical protein L6R36_004186 [Xanthoria steineri]|nr:MAG: hypothetical protein L6R36_004186 [Xanthoria steineri]